LRRLLLLCCSVLLALVLGEAAARWLGGDPEPSVKYRFHPSYGWTMDPAGWPIDELRPSGFRGPELVATAPRPRVLVLGDSFTVAVEQAWSRTFAGILAAELGSRGGSVASLAAGGWGTAQEYLALRREGLAWKPDVVVLQVFPYNDVCDNSLAMVHACSWMDYLRPYFVLHEGRLAATWLQPLRARLRRLSRLAGLVDRTLWLHRLGVPGESEEAFWKRTLDYTRANARRLGLADEGRVYTLMPEPLQPPPVRQAWAVTEALFAAIAEELAERRIPLLAVVIPFNKTFEPEWSDYRKTRPPGLEPDHDTRRCEAAFARLGVPVVSVRQRLEAEGLVAGTLFNRKNQHLSTRGHALTARWILEELARLRGFEGTLP